MRYSTVAVKHVCWNSDLRGRQDAPLVNDEGPAEAEPSLMVGNHPATETRLTEPPTNLENDESPMDSIVSQL